MPAIGLRPATAEDREFLLRVYAATREEELAMTDWSVEQKARFVQMQFDAQDAYYREHYAGAQFFVIKVDGEPAGRLYVHHRPDEIRLMDIALLPGYRNRGVGSSLLNDLLSQARSQGKGVGIHVEKHNPAMRLYESLGFRRKADRGVYDFLLWLPS
jgi:ribosomal protein S18 acetylase RimI-like enzyme